MKFKSVNTNKTVKKIILTNRDFKILKFLWRWKYATTAGLAVKFFPHCTKKTAYKRINLLRNAKLVQSETVKFDRGRIWTLDTRGYKLIEEQLPSLSSPGFRAENPTHDFLVSSVHIGDWLMGLPKGCDLFSEQQLRRIDSSIYPNWVPDCDYYRPDGYWYLSNGVVGKVLSLEVETTQKHLPRYDKVKSFYETQNDVAHCIWVVRTPQMANKINQALYINDNKKSIHQFLLIKDIIKYNWFSPIILGKFKGSTLVKFMNSLVQNKYGIKHDSVLGQALVDTSPSIDKSISYKSRKKT